MGKEKYAHGNIFNTLFHIQDKETIVTRMIVHGVDPIDVILRKVAFSRFSGVYDTQNTVIFNIIESLFFCDCSKDAFLILCFYIIV